MACRLQWRRGQWQLTSIAWATAPTPPTFLASRSARCATKLNEYSGDGVPVPPPGNGGDARMAGGDIGPSGPGTLTAILRPRGGGRRTVVRTRRSPHPTKASGAVPRPTCLDEGTAGQHPNALIWPVPCPASL